MTKFSKCRSWMLRLILQWQNGGVHHWLVKKIFNRLSIANYMARRNEHQRRIAEAIAFLNEEEQAGSRTSRKIPGWTPQHHWSLGSGQSPTEFLEKSADLNSQIECGVPTRVRWWLVGTYPTWKWYNGTACGAPSESELDFPSLPMMRKGHTAITRRSSTPPMTCWMVPAYGTWEPAC